MISSEKILSPPQELEVPKSFHKDNRTRLINNFKTATNGEFPPNSIFFFKGDITRPIHDTDWEHTFQQESNYLYLFGAQDPDLYGIIEIDTGKTTIIAPKLSAETGMWFTIRDAEYYKKFYEVEDSIYVQDLESHFKTLNPASIYFFYGQDLSSQKTPDLPTFSWLDQYKVDKDILFQILSDTRAIKSKMEVDLMRFVNQMCSEAHIRVMRNAKIGIKEYQLEALFKFHSQERCGARFQAYDCICGSGRDAATLHYICNDKVLVDGALLLADMGAKYYGYCADITVTFPINGKFTQKQKEIYDAVLDAQNAVKKVIKAGTIYRDMHLLAERVMVEHLIKIGIIHDTPMEKLIEAGIGSVFFPHALGHLIGLRVHDIGSNLRPHPVTKERKPLDVGVCLTIEPGIYFVEYGLGEAKKHEVKSQYINWEKVEEYKEVGGVRLEDVVVITQDGFECLSDVPRTTEEVEKCMAGLEWKAKTTQ
jgi:Xaa-Pro dipeptidase